MTGALVKPIRSYRDLIAWQKGMDLVDMVYDIADNFPTREQFGLRSQITRAAVSVPSNIAEGHGRSTSRDFAHFLDMARSSVLEVETQLLVALRRRFATQQAVDDALSLAGEVSRILIRLRQQILVKNRRP